MKESMKHKIERRAFGKRFFGALAAFAAVLFVKPKTVERRFRKLTPAELKTIANKYPLPWRFEGESAWSTSDGICYVGDADYPWTVSNGTQHFGTTWKKV